MSRKWTGVTAPSNPCRRLFGKPSVEDTQWALNLKNAPYNQCRRVFSKPSSSGSPNTQQLSTSNPATPPGRPQTDYDSSEGEALHVTPLKAQQLSTSIPDTPPTLPSKRLKLAQTHDDSSEGDGLLETPLKAQHLWSPTSLPDTPLSCVVCGECMPLEDEDDFHECDFEVSEEEEAGYDRRLALFSAKGPWQRAWGEYLADKYPLGELWFLEPGVDRAAQDAATALWHHQQECLKKVTGLRR